MPSYGQRLYHLHGMVGVEGCPTPDHALWRAAHMLFRTYNVTRRQARKALTAEQRDTP